MAPADVERILVVGVLAVVDQQVGVAGEVVTGDPLRLVLGENGPQRRLVVRDIADGRVALGDAEAERWAAVVDRLAADGRRAELPLAGRRVAEEDVAGELTDLHRRKRRRDVAGDSVLEGGLGRGRAPDRDVGVGAKAGREEHQALDVVQVQVREQDVHVGRNRQVQAQRADAGAGVEDDVLAARERELHARRVTPVSVHLRPRRRNRSASSPDLESHVRSLRLPSWGQKKIIAPEEPSSDATIGKALDSISRMAPLAERIVNTAWAGRPSRTARVVGRSSSGSGVPLESNGPYVVVHSSGDIRPTSSNERPRRAPAASLKKTSAASWSIRNAGVEMLVRRLRARISSRGF